MTDTADYYHDIRDYRFKRSLGMSHREVCGLPHPKIDGKRYVHLFEGVCHLKNVCIYHSVCKYNGRKNSPHTFIPLEMGIHPKTKKPVCFSYKSYRKKRHEDHEACSWIISNHEKNLTKWEFGFLSSLCEQLKDDFDLTERQRCKLDEIISKFPINNIKGQGNDQSRNRSPRSL